MRPVMSAEMSTFFLGWILPLAVTAATRSLRPTVSKRTSTPLSRFALAERTISPTTRMPPPAKRNSLPRFDMSIPILELVQRLTDRRFERGAGLVIVVDGCDVVTFRFGVRHLRIHHVEERPRAHAVPVGSELQSVLGRCPISVLDRNSLIGGLERQVSVLYQGTKPERLCPGRLIGLLLVGLGLGHRDRLLKIAPEGDAHPDRGLERLLGEMERVLRILIN